MVLSHPGINWRRSLEIIDGMKVWQWLRLVQRLRRIPWNAFERKLRTTRLTESQSSEREREGGKEKTRGRIKVPPAVTDCFATVVSLLDGFHAALITKNVPFLCETWHGSFKEMEKSLPVGKAWYGWEILEICSSYPRDGEMQRESWAMKDFDVSTGAIFSVDVLLFFKVVTLCVLFS